MFKRTQASMRFDYNILVLCIIFGLAFLLLFKPWVHGYDPVGYYSWLRSAVIDNDLNTTNEYEFFGKGDFGGTVIETGYRNNPYGIGSALLWLPFFLIAHAVTLVGRSLGIEWVAADGYTFPYVLAVSFGSAIYAWLGLLLTYKIARDLFVAKFALLGVITVWLASPLIFYQFSHPIMSHANDAFAYALFLFTWYKTRENRNVFQYGLLGLVAGLCALIRLQNAILVIFPLSELIYNFVVHYKKSKDLQLLRIIFLKGAVFSLAWWTTFFPQLFVWRTIFGVWWPGNPYASSDGGDFDFFRPNILGVWFSNDHGLFIWTPVILLAVIGWFFVYHKEQRLTTMLVLNFLLQTYIVASWSSWSGAASFGQRFFTNMVPAFALGVVGLLNYLDLRVKFRWLVVGCTGFIIWNGLLLVRYIVGDIAHAGPTPIDQLIIGQFTVIPRYFYRIIQILVTRH